MANHRLPEVSDAVSARLLDERCEQWRARIRSGLEPSLAECVIAGLALHRVTFRHAIPESLRLVMLDRECAIWDPVARLSIAGALRAVPGRDLSVRVPDSICELWRLERIRIIDRLLNETNGPASLLADSWCKELLIGAGALLPIGAGFVDVLAGVPRSYLFRGGAAQFLRGLRALVSAGGHAPFAELHAHTESIAGFSPEGWLAAYRVLAELLLLNPHLRGVIRGNWFIDPRIARISPRLTYTRAVPEQHGATFLFVAHDTAGTSGALARSPTRQQLFERGLYVPQIHMMIWPRRDLIRAFGQ